MERDPKTHAIIGAAMEVHNIVGPGHLEAVYHECLEIEFKLRKIPYISKPKLKMECPFSCANNSRRIIIRS